MFARNVSLRLKPNTLREFTRIFDKEVIPMLRKQSGFRDAITFAIPGGLHTSNPRGRSIVSYDSLAGCAPRDAIGKLIRLSKGERLQMG